jgi:hypothetical protein
MAAPRLRSAPLAVAASAVTVLLLSAVSYGIGRRLDPELRLFDPRRAPTIDEAGAAQPIQYALCSDETNDVVFFGDSTCRDGIDPKRLSLSAYNIGSARGLGPNGMAVTVMGYLLHHPKPRLVVLCVSPFCFEVDIGTAGGDFPDRFVANYGPELSGVVPITDSFSYFIKRGAVSVIDGKAREVRDDPLDGFPRETYRTLASKMLASRGFFSLPGEHGPQREVDRPGPTNIVNDDWDRWIRRVAACCKSDGIPLLVQFSPISSECADARDWSQLDRWAAELEASHPNVTVTRPIITPYEPRFMWDQIHLNAAGVEKFMPIVAKDVQQALK